MPQHCTTMRDLRVFVRCSRKYSTSTGNEQRMASSMCPRMLISRPRVHVIETALGEGRVATTSTRESVMLSDIVRHLRRPSTLKHKQENSSMACVGETGEVPRGRNDERRLQGEARACTCLLPGRSADEVVLGGSKRLGGTSAMFQAYPWPRWPVSRRPTMSKSRKVIPIYLRVWAWRPHTTNRYDCIATKLLGNTLSLFTDGGYHACMPTLHTLRLL